MVLMSESTHVGCLLVQARVVCQLEAMGMDATRLARLLDCSEETILAYWEMRELLRFDHLLVLCEYMGIDLREIQEAAWDVLIL